MVFVVDDSLESLICSICKKDTRHMFRNYEEVILKRFGFYSRGESPARAGLGAATAALGLAGNDESRATT
jgi:hypothetical protein